MADSGAHECPSGLGTNSDLRNMYCLHNNLDNMPTHLIQPGSNYKREHIYVQHPLGSYLAHPALYGLANW